MRTTSLSARKVSLNTRNILPVSIHRMHAIGLRPLYPLGLTAALFIAAESRAQFVSCNTWTAGSNLDTFDLQAADLDADGDLDLIEVQRVSGVIRAYLNRSNSNPPIPPFSTASLLPAPLPPDNGQQFYSVRVADLDADGIPDVIASDTRQHDIVTWRGTGAGQFSVLSVYHSPGGNGGGGGYYYFDLGDVNGDHYIDLVTTDASNRVVVGLNGGAAAPGLLSFQPYVFPQVSSGNDWFAPYGIALGDWDSDGDLDIAFTGWRGYRSTQYPCLRFMDNNGSGIFSAPVSRGSFTGYLKGMDLAVADFNADGRDDICMVDAAYDPLVQAPIPVRLFLNLGGGTWSQQTVANLQCDPTRIATGDVEGDGDIDILVACYKTATGVIDRGLHVLTNPLAGGGNWSSSRTYGNGVGGVAFADFDGDGRRDLAFRTNTQQIRIDLNCGTAPFSAAFGIASFGSRGFSEMQTAGLPAVGGLLSLRAPNLRPNALGAVLLGVHLVPPLDLSTVFLPSLPPAGTPLLFVDPIFVFGSSVDPFGVLSHQIAIPASPSLQGITVSTQGIVFDPTAGLTGLTTTRPVRHFLW
ncbi:MAG: VCBS repeat-containing protein [Planctomycetota bacterium]